REDTAQGFSFFSGRSLNSGRQCPAGRQPFTAVERPVHLSSPHFVPGRTRDVGAISKSAEAVSIAPHNSKDPPLLTFAITVQLFPTRITRPGVTSGGSFVPATANVVVKRSACDRNEPILPRMPFPANSG